MPWKLLENIQYGKQMAAFIFHVRTVLKDYILLYDKLLLPLRLAEPFKILLYCVRNTEHLTRGHVGDTKPQ